MIMTITKRNCQPEEAPSVNERILGRRRCRILLVDDNPTLAQAVESMLATVAWIQIIGTASSGEQALERIVDLEPDMVLLDLTMPGMDGLEVTRTLVERPRRPRVLMMTAHIDDHYRRAADDAGVDGFILKSDLWEKLVALIDSLL